MLIEVCAYSLASCLTAQTAGADRIELCGGQPEGGTTPSAGLIRLARRHLQIPLSVMIRPRGGDFLYADTELAVMEADIETAKSYGVDGIVLGVLRTNGTVDEAATYRFVRQAHPLPVTFHRAFDVARDPAEALEAIIRAGAARVLTSGQQPTAEAGRPLIRQLVQQAAGRIEIIAGAGVNAQNALLLMHTGIDTLHLSGSLRTDSPMTYRNPIVSMATAVADEYERLEADEAKIRAVIGAVAT